MTTRSYKTGLFLALVALIATALPAFAEPRDDSLADACEGAPETTFVDEARLTPEEDTATDCLAADGWDNIVQGFEDNTYRPRIDVDRETMAVFVARLLAATGVTLPSNPPNAFDDDDNSPYHKEINQLADLGIVSGRPDTNDADNDGNTEEELYFPDDPVRRDQMAKFIVNAIEETSGENLAATEDQFPDEDCDESLEPHVNALAENNIVSGTSATTYSCDDAVSRGQMALFLARSLDWLVENGYETNPFTTVVESGLIDAPELVSATVQNEASNSVVIRYTFDEALSGTPNAGCFHLYAFDLADFPTGAQATCAGGHPGDNNALAASADGASATIVSGNTAAVDVTFAITPAQLDDVTVATVDYDAVRDADGRSNPEGDAAIQSVSIPARTTVAPDLTQVTAFDATADTVEFVFDETVGGVLNQEAFVLIETDGDVKVSDAAEVKAGDTTRVVATFNDAGNDGSGGDAPEDPGIVGNQATATARGAVLANAVSDTAQDPDTEGTEGETNVLQVVAVANNGNTDDPDLVGIDVDRTQNQVFFQFDTAIQLGGNNATCDDTAAPLQSNDAPGNCFHIYDRDGNQINADSAEVDQSDNTQVIATYGAGELDTAVGATVDENAVTTTDDNAVGVELDAEGITSTTASGRTLAPDLVSAQRQTNEGQLPGEPDTVVVIYTFDENVDAGSLNASRFFIYAQDGTAHEAQSVATGPNDNQVEATFSSNEVVNAAQSAGVNHGGVRDDSAKPNPEGYTRLQAEAS